MGNNFTTINARKFDGTIHRTWSAKLIKRKNPLLLFVGEFDREVNHPDLGVIRRGTISYEYYWLDRWYNIFRFHEPNGDFRNFYCNINVPPTFENNILDYIDLDIDVLLWKNEPTEILDQDEYHANSVKYEYPTHVKNNVRKSLTELTNLIDNQEFPFNTTS